MTTSLSRPARSPTIWPRWWPTPPGKAASTRLRPARRPRTAGPTPLPPVPGQLGVQEIDSSIAGRPFQLERPVVVPNGESFARWIPLVDGSERLGVLYLCSPTLSDEVLARCQDLTGLVAELVVSKNQYGDALTVARRTQDMLLAAELRWGCRHSPSPAST